jgi:RHS repeat-associated protein
VTVTDRRQQSSAAGVTVDYYQADVAGANDYYPFGMQMPGRKYSVSSAYRYGFNGRENEKDINSGSLDYGARIYDSRLGCWFSVDAYADKYPDVSPYSFSINSPLQYKDANGNWLVDKDGNIIYTIGEYSYEKNGSEIIRVQLIYFYTNDGQRVEAGRYDSKTSVDNVIFFDEERTRYKDVKDQNKIVDIPGSSSEAFNCHGYTLNGNPLTLGNPLDDRYTMRLYGVNLYIGGRDENGKDNVSKIYKNKSEFTPVNAKDVQPGDVAIFDDGKGYIAHSATVTQVGKRGRKVKLDSKDDRKEIQRNLTIKQIKKQNKTDFKRFVGYYRHKTNKKNDMNVGVDGDAGDPDGELIKKVIEEAKKE